MKTKNLLRIIVFLFIINTQNLYAQVHIEALDFPSDVSVPTENQIFAKHKIISDSSNAYIYVDNCKILFYDYGNFSGMSLRNIRFFADNIEITMQMKLLGDYWEFYPGTVLGFPYGYADTIEIYFTANIPDTIPEDYIPNVGDSLNTSMYCICHYSSGTGNFYTDTASSKTLIVSSSSVGIKENLFSKQNSPQSPAIGGIGNIKILNKDVKIYDILGREIYVPENLPQGIYIWKLGFQSGKIFVF